jgi:hypothetical protein
MKTLFVAWQEPVSREWIPVARLTHERGYYRFQYTRGAKKSKNFEPFGWMRDLGMEYISEDLFPLFANRILPKSRPEYRDYLRWLGLNEQEYSDLAVLARSGGVRATDSLEIFPCPEPDDDGRYTGYFFCHGLRHLPDNDRQRVKRLKVGQSLFLMRDLQNKFDRDALVIRTEAPISFVGYCPRYYSAEFSSVLKKVDPREIIVQVERVNPDAPSELALLCKLQAPWPRNYSPCSKGTFRGLAKTLSTTKGSRSPRKSVDTRI